MEPAGESPEWLRGLIEALEFDPGRRWQDSDLLGMDLEQTRVRRVQVCHSILVRLLLIAGSLIFTPLEQDPLLEEIQSREVWRPLA